MKIIITGSLGNISKPLAIALRQKGHTVTVISSNPEKRRDIEALGAIAAIGLLENVDFLISTFKGADALYAMMPPNFGEPDQIAYYHKISSNYAQAVQQSGIKRVVNLSSYGAHLDKGTGFILGAYHTERILNELPGVAITHLRPGYFYYNLYHFIDMIKGQGFISSNFGDNDRIVLVSPQDIATAASEEFETNTGKVRYVASSEHTASEIAQTLGTAIGKPHLTWKTITSEEMRSAMEQRGVPAHLIINYVELGASLHSGALNEDYELHRPTAMGKVKLEEFAKEFAAAF